MMIQIRIDRVNPAASLFHKSYNFNKSYVDDILAIGPEKIIVISSSSSSASFLSAIYFLPSLSITNTNFSSV